MHQPRNDVTDDTGDPDELVVLNDDVFFVRYVFDLISVEFRFLHRSHLGCGIL